MKRIAVILLVCAISAGCVSPLDRTSEQQLRESLMQSHQQFQRAVAAGSIELTRPDSEVETELAKRDGAIEQLDSVSGPASYREQPIKLGRDLQGNEDPGIIEMGLRDAIHLAVRNNIDLKLARLTPAIRQTQITQAQAVFDATFYTDLNAAWLEIPNQAVIGSIDRNTVRLETGIIKPLHSGGAVSLAVGAEYADQSPTIGTINPSSTLDVALGIQQPLLRGFGSDINTARITLARSAQRQSVEQLRSDLISIINATEAAYWNLVLARAQLQISTRLYERTEAERRRLGPRREQFDVAPPVYTDVLAREELRRGDVIRARQQVRVASDALKRLINDPRLPLAAEHTIVPTDTPVDATLELSLLDAVTTALQRRPEMRIALLSIQDATVRQRVADNARLPVLDLVASVNFTGNARRMGNAADSLVDGDFISYLVGMRFETQLGNRGPEALLHQRTLERRQSVINYQRQAQDVVQDVKSTMRDLSTAYELVAVARAARRAAAENLRALVAQEEAGGPLTPEFIDLKLRREDALAETERLEIQSLTDYNNAISAFFQSLGTLLERNQIAFEVEAPH